MVASSVAVAHSARLALQSRLLSVYLPAVANLYDHHSDNTIVDGVENPVITLPDSIFLLSRELFRLRRPRVFGQRPDLFYNPFPRLFERFECSRSEGSPKSLSCEP